MRVALFGLVWAVPDAAVLLLAVVGDGLMQLQVRFEEAHLQRLHGAAWVQYQAGVGRWWGAGGIKANSLQ